MNIIPMFSLLNLNYSFSLELGIWNHIQPMVTGTLPETPLTLQSTLPRNSKQPKSLCRRRRSLRPIYILILDNSMYVLK